MRERQILFSGPMVRAILDGRKTQTRRVVMKQPKLISGAWYWHSRRYNNGDGANYLHTDERSAARLMPSACPYGQPGDRLWVRETWRPSASAPVSMLGRGLSKRHLRFAADYDEYTVAEKGPWKPSIHMPRWASRLTLEITGVRVERLQAISEQDAMAEGLIEWTDPPRVETKHYGLNRADVWETTASGAFRRLWDSLNAARGHGWDANPWVWVIDFRRIS